MHHHKIDLRKNITENFQFHEALMLASWDIYCFPNTESVLNNIILTANKLEKIRKILKVPMHVTSWYRPPHYNITIGGARKSYHMQGLACDFVPIGMHAQQAREMLLPHLDDLEVRMENNGRDAKWVHIDLGAVGKSGRYFTP